MSGVTQAMVAAVQTVVDSANNVLSTIDTAGAKPRTSAFTPISSPCHPLVVGQLGHRPFGQLIAVRRQATAPFALPGFDLQDHDPGLQQGLQRQTHQHSPDAGGNRTVRCPVCAVSHPLAEARLSPAGHRGIQE